MGVHGVSLILCQSHSSHSSEAADLDRSVGPGVHHHSVQTQNESNQFHIIHIKGTSALQSACLLQKPLNPDTITS